MLFYLWKGLGKTLSLSVGAVVVCALAHGTGGVSTLKEQSFMLLLFFFPFNHLLITSAYCENIIGGEWEGSEFPSNVRIYLPCLLLLPGSWLLFYEVHQAQTAGKNVQGVWSTDILLPEQSTNHMSVSSSLPRRFSFKWSAWPVFKREPFNLMENCG